MMSRKLLLCVGLALLGVLVVAMVQAQDFSSGKDEPSRQERSVLKSTATPSSESEGSSSGSVYRSADGRVGSPTFSSRRGALADRLHQARRTISADGAASGALSDERPQDLAPIVDMPTSTPQAPRHLEPAPLDAASDSRQPTSVFHSPAPTGNQHAPVVISPGHNRASSRRVHAEPKVLPSARPTQSPAYGIAPSTPRTTIQPRVTLRSAGPTLHVETTGPNAIVIDKEATYQITLVNSGPIDASDIYVRVAVPKWVEVIDNRAASGSVERKYDGGDDGRWIWTVSQLAAGSRQQMELTVVPRESQPFTMTVDWTLRPQAASAQITVQQPQLRVAIEGPSDVLYGSTAQYAVQVANPGSGPAENVAVEVVPGVSGGQTKSIGTIPAGGQREIRFELTAREAGQMSIIARAVADGGLRSETMREVKIRRAELKVQVEAPEHKFAGAPATYLIHISNVGDAMASQVVATATLPSGAKYLSGIEEASSSRGRVDWSIDNLEPGAQRTFQLDCELTLEGDNQFQVQTQAAGSLQAVSTAVTQVEAIADVKLLVHDPKGPKPVGVDTVYEIHVINQGSKAAEQVRVIGQFSRGIEPVRTEGATAELVPGQVLFQPIARLAAGETLVLRVVARADEAGNHKFRAQVECSDPETSLVAEDMTRFFRSKRAQSSIEIGSRGADTSSSRR